MQPHSLNSVFRSKYKFSSEVYWFLLCLTIKKEKSSADRFPLFSFTYVAQLMKLQMQKQYNVHILFIFFISAHIEMVGLLPNNQLSDIFNLKNLVFDTEITIIFLF